MAFRIKSTDEFKELRPVIKVIGLGGAGGNAINRMVDAGVRDVELIAANTDAQDLRRSKAPVRIQIGERETGGLGVGGDPMKGRLAALESKDQFREALAGANLVFITAGMGGGTGTGSGAVVAELAREARALTIGVVSRPFEFEGRKRALQAEEGIRDMRGHVDTLLVIPNDSLFKVIDDRTPSAEAFRRADDVLRQAIQGISDLITAPGEINMDLNDVRAIMADAGEAHIGIGEASGDRRHMEAAKQAVESPLLENVSVDGAKGLLVNFCSDRRNLTQSEIKLAMDFIGRKVSPDAKIKYGQVYDESLGEKLRITVIATGFPARKGRLWGGALGRRVRLADDPLEALARPAAREAADGDGSGPPPEDWTRPAFLHWKVRRLR